MKKIFAYLFATLLALGGCAKAPETAANNSGGIADANGLVITASHEGAATRTDIVAGKTSWEAGDRITVVYDGAAYEYVAASAGATTDFTSEAGIAAYDPAKELVAYYPPTTPEGVVSVAAQRTITLGGEEQTNPAQAPLVGTPTEGEFTDGALHVKFRNIFSVVELRIDAGEMASPARSLTITPADEAAFEGFLSFEGTVDAETLALTPASDGTGSSLTFDFGEDIDLTKPQTIKFPVGRFSSEAGLKLTLATADGETYSRNIYKTGITSFTEKEGVFRAKHLAKALYAFAPYGGIATADDLVEFAAAVNAGQSTSPWQDERGVVVLLDDIDMSGITEWRPIGEAVSTDAINNIVINSGRPFTGWFDGQGHVVSNLDMVCRNATENAAWGFFGAVASGGTVENLVFDESCSLLNLASVATNCGVAAGLVHDATVRNIENNAAIHLDGTAPDAKRVTSGVIGFAFSSANGVLLEDIVNYGKLTANQGNSKVNGATGLHVGGIVGFSSNNSSSTVPVVIRNCVNYGDLDTAAGRASGIAAAANRYTVFEGCVNEGDNISRFPESGASRIGNITVIAGQGCRFTDCVNRGDIICTANGCAGGIVCLVNHADVVLTRCENYGTIVTDRPGYRGTLFGQCNQGAGFTDCIAQGDLGTYNGGSYVLVGVNPDNYFSYIGDHNANGVNVTPQNILYFRNGAELPAEAEFGVNTASFSLNTQGSNSAVVQLSSVDHDWTVGSDAPWLHITDLDGAPVVSGPRSANVQYVKFSAAPNRTTSTRTANVTFESVDKTASAAVSISQAAMGEAFPSRWIFSSTTNATYSTAWTSDGILPATNSGAGTISVVRGGGSQTPFTRTISSYRPHISTLTEGDYWLYTFPVASLPAGTAIDFNATMGGQKDSPKYFIVEYLDGGEWKSVEEDLLTASEDPGLKYSYKLSGLGTASSYQHTTVMQTVRFENAITDGDVKIRCRAVGPYTCGNGQAGSMNFIPPSGFTGSYVQNFGTAEPEDVKKVLLIGNSFSYYSNPAWMLKEIAWREGHAMKMTAHFKGSQTFTQHMSLATSLEAIDRGGYDVAFLQDNSAYAAQYGRGDVNMPEILAGTNAIVGRVRSSSPSCKIVLEQTWAFSAAGYGGFGSYAAFDDYSDTGAKALAQAIDSWVSPIAPAFEEARGNGSINLYTSDNKHQSEYGAYLKACVNYLVLYGEEFGENPADCGLDPVKTAYLRRVAEDAVLGHEGEYFIER